MRVLFTALAITVLSSLPFTTYALEIKSAHVVIEDGSEFNKCYLRKESLLASVESALRSNSIKPSNDLINPVFYVRVNVLDINSEFCAVSMRLSVRSYQYVEAKLAEIERKTVFAKVELFEQDGIFFLKKMNVQYQLNNELRQLVDESISGIARMK